MSQSRIKSPLLLLLGLLLLLVPVLAWLQWRWIGEISDHEAERLRLNVRTSSAYAAWNVNQRFMALQQVFTLPAADNDSTLAEELSEATGIWKQHNDSLLAASVYVLHGTDKKLFRFDVSSKQLRTVPDTLLAALHIDRANTTPITISRVTRGLRALIIPIYPKNMYDSSSQRSPGFQHKDFFRTNGAQKISAQRKVLQKISLPQELRYATMMPTARGNFSMNYVIVVPDSVYLRKSFLPSIVRTYFHEREYQWAVVQNDDSTLLSTSEPNLSLGEVSKPDFATPIGFVPARTQGRMGRTMAALAMRMPLVIAAGNDSIVRNQRFSLPTLHSAMNGVTQSTTQLANADSTFMRELLGTTELRVVAARGSLEREVAALRWRNLAVSFGALLVLAGGLVVVFAAVMRSERLARQQMQFVAGVSHELRTPLAVLHSASENLADGIVKTPEQARRYGQVMKREITRLMEMVEQTLTFAGIQSGRRNGGDAPTTTDVQTLVEECLERNAALLESEHCAPTIQIQSDLPPVYADSRALGSVLDNLLSNALKYSVGECTLRITSAQVGKEIVIGVHDTGRGIAAKEQKRIFEPFYRTNEAIEAQIHGNGLGLAIAQHIVKQHGGFVSVASDIGKGSTFSVHLPIAKQ